MKINLTKMKKLAIIVGLIVVIAASALVATSIAQSQQRPSSNTSSSSSNGERFTLSSKSVSQNGLTIQATPQPFNYGEPVKINLVLDTHSGDLSFDLTQLTTMRDSNAATYVPTGWNGSAPGGHHVSGTLNFPALSGQPSSIQLILKNVNGADWIFEWPLTN